MFFAGMSGSQIFADFTWLQVVFILLLRALLGARVPKYPSLSTVFGPDYGNFETFPPYDSKLTYNTTMYYMHVLLVLPDSQIALRFTLLPTVFNLHDIMRQVCQLTPK